MAKLWTCVVRVHVTKHVLVQADTMEEAQYELANNRIVHELQEWEDVLSRKVARQFSREPQDAEANVPND